MEPSDREARRLEQLQQLPDEEFALEVRQHQASRWRPTRLEPHAKKHRHDFAAGLGRVLSLDSWRS